MTTTQTSLAVAVIALAALTACRQSPPPSPVASPATSNAPPLKPSAPAPPAASPIGTTKDTPAAQPPGSADGILSALGAGADLPDGLNPGGECPAADADASTEIAAQAQAAIPLKEGLTLSYAWTKTPQEEYECLIQITKIAPGAIDTSASCNVPGQTAPVIKRICRSDLRHARLIHTLYGAVKVLGPSGEDEPETIVGATAFTVSTDDFAKMQKTGAMLHHYVEVGDSGRLVKDGVGELHVDDRGTLRVVVNDGPLDVPVIKLSGKAKWWIRGKRLETTETAVVLDDARFPLYLDQQSTAAETRSRIKFATITYPSDDKGKGQFTGQGNGQERNGRGSIEDALLEEKHVDVYGIYFDFNSDRIRPESDPVLKEIGTLMQKYPDWRLSIAGHTDNIGGNGNYNLELSRRRSEAVKRALVDRFRISTDRMTTSGYGAGAPKDTNDTPEGRARNRRVELVRQ